VFEGFKFEYVDVGDATLRVPHGGDRLWGSKTQVARSQPSDLQAGTE
jgi:hypothetical protein